MKPGGTFHFQGCYVDSVRLIATGGIRYEWSPEEYANDPHLANPMAYPPKGNSTFTVKIKKLNVGNTTLQVPVFLPETPVAEIVPDTDTVFMNHGDPIILWTENDTTENTWFTIRDEINVHRYVEYSSPTIGVVGAAFAPHTAWFEV